MNCSGWWTVTPWGPLPAARVGAGSAVNDTREIGGTLAVAIVGSVMNSIYGSPLVAALGGTSLTPEQVLSASRSVTGGFEAAALVPPAETASVVAATSQAFVDGLSAGSWVAAAATGIAAIGVLVFVPSRHL